MTKAALNIDTTSKDFEKTLTTGEPEIILKKVIKGQVKQHHLSSVTNVIKMLGAKQIRETC